ncbi:MAG: ROK family protein [Vulcanimicrobiaceae bacterium]
MSVRFGVDLGGTKTEIVALADDERELLRRRVATPATDYEAIVATIARLVDGAERELGTRGSVGIGTPGTPSRQTGRMKNANSTVLNGRPFADDVAAALGRPVRVANDANCFALSEATDGAARRSGTVFGVILGTGAGGGLVAGGRIVVGRNDIAGEWGHNPLPWPHDDERPGPACYCGKAGCIETFVSGTGLQNDHRAHGGEALDGPTIARAAASGAPAALATLERYVDRLARALATVVNVFDPDAIVLGGGLSNVSAIAAALPARMRAYVFSDTFETAIVRPRHGDSSGVRGAARLWDEAREA